MARQQRRKPERRNGGWWAFLHTFVAKDAEERGQLPDLSTEEILAWADAYRAHTGRWPIYKSGPIPEAPGETWLAVEAALSIGLRGCPPGSTLARFLTEHRGKYNPQDPPRLTIEQILDWADAWHQRTGEWPHRLSGEIPDRGGMNWNIVDKALCYGRCGLPSGSRLAHLLWAERGAYNHYELPRWTVAQILAWADRHFERTGSWPTCQSGPITEAPEETWKRVDEALRKGLRGLPHGSSVARLLAAERGVCNPCGLPALTVPQILAWADAFQARTGRWPTVHAGPIPEAPRETWMGVHKALSLGRRGLPGGSSLARLLAQERGMRNIKNLPPLTHEQILEWAEAHQRRTGSWPKSSSGAVADAPGETWGAIDRSLFAGQRGLPGGSSLAQLLAQERGVRNKGDLPPLNHEQILQWAEAHQRRTGTWPTRYSGPIVEAPGETWNGVSQALYVGLRGLPGGTSLPQLLRQHFHTEPCPQPTG